MEEQQERRTSSIQLYADISELKTDVKYIIKTLDEMKEDNKMRDTKINDKCDDCQPAKDLKAHIQDSKEHKKWGWDRVVFTVTSALSLLAIIVVLALGIVNIKMDKANPIVRQSTSQVK